MGEIISIFHGCKVWIEKSDTRVTDRHHEACRVMPNSDPDHGCMVWIEKSVTRATDRHHEACRVMPNSDPE